MDSSGIADSAKTTSHHKISAHRESSRIASFCIPALLILACAVLFIASRTVPGFAEWYSDHIYPAIVGSVGRLTGYMPFSVGEAAVIALPFIVIADIVYNHRCLLKSLRHMILLACILCFLYYANCGVNYYRDPFVPEESLAGAQFTDEQLADFCAYTIEQIKKTEVRPQDEEPGSLYPQGRELAEDARRSMIMLAEDCGELEGFYPVPKQLTLLSGFFSSMGVSGIYSPFTVEANINGEMPGMEKPFTACHELSHLRGYMNEGEANYIGWLACIGSDVPSFNRSGWLVGWNYAGGTLRRVDPERFAELFAELPEDAVRELAENHEFWLSHESRASEVQDRVNDTYLKANGQDEGIHTYSRLTTLMLMWYYS